jgi:hypothetical protein
VKKIIASGIEGGHFKRCDPARVASALVGLIEGFTIQWIFDEKAFDLSRAQKMTEEIILRFLKK